MSIPEGTKTKFELIEVNLYDDDGNCYPRVINMYVNEYEVTVLNVWKNGNVTFNNPDDDIKDAIRKAGYKTHEIKLY